MIKLLSGDLELNPGPPGEKWRGSIAGSKVDVTIDYWGWRSVQARLLHFGHLNVRSFSPVCS